MPLRTKLKPGEKRWIKCKTSRCRNLIDLMTRNDYRCSKCWTRIRKEKNPIRYFFDKLKYRAKERGHEFLLTLEEWAQFCRETNILELRGKTGSSMSVDRMDNDRGYSYDNIQPLTVAENSSKSRKGHVAFFQNQRNLEEQRRAA